MPNFKANRALLLIHRKTVIQAVSKKIIFTFLLISASYLAHSQSSNYTLKAFYIEKFTRFVEWPEECNTANKEPFQISVYGKTPFKKTLTDIFSIQKIYQREVRIQEVQSLDDIHSCQIVFIAGNKKNTLAEDIKQLRNKPVLTISDTPGFGQEGVLINFFIKNDTLSFEVNQEALEDSPLQISYYMLDIAKIINPVNY